MESHTQDDYKTLDVELRAERAQAAELRASMQAELERVRGSREELEQRLARLRERAKKKKKKKDDGDKPGATEGLWTLCCLLLIFTCGLGQSTLFQHVIAPLRCGGLCSANGSDYTGLFRRGGGGENANMVTGCVCRSRSKPAWISTSDESVIFTEWFGVMRFLGSFALPIMILIGVILGYKMRRKRARAG